MTARRLGALAATAAALANVLVGATLGETVWLWLLIGVMWRMKP